ncbi:hypothetical protein [Duganella sp. HH105]|uniref:hypothetical protein n=1 Tax=Duganella sp. HH105 TaxID=1781067 RepID=UPI000877CCB5|nr:hypothetical protein [Duganella sp. HH105]OEZ61652.1 hypothetical protein DUGA6_21020 [Duganella sp. HH105]
MNMLKPALTLAFLLGALASPDAWTQGRGHGGGGHGYHHGHGHGHGYVRGGIIVGAPVYWPRYGYLDPYYDRYYYPPGYYVGAPLYLPPADAPSLPRRLYYCGNPRGYFPNVGACLVPWRVLTATVVPSP